MTEINLKVGNQNKEIRLNWQAKEYVTLALVLGFKGLESSVLICMNVSPTPTLLSLFL